MSKIPVYFPGGSVVVMFRVWNRQNGLPIPLNDYRAEAAFYTRLLERRIHACSGADPSKIPITAANDYTLRIDLPPEETARLPHGNCTVKITLTHRTDGSRLTACRKIFTLKEAPQVLYLNQKQTNDKQ